MSVWNFGNAPSTIDIVPDRAIKDKVASLHYNNASEVIREALRLTLKHDVEYDWLKREAAFGFAQLEAGETVQINTKEEFEALARQSE